MTVDDLLRAKQAVHELCITKICDSCPFEEPNTCVIVRFESDIDVVIDYIKTRDQWEDKK